MNRYIRLIPKENYDPNFIIFQISSGTVYTKQRGENCFMIWNPDKSTTGFDLYFHEDYMRLNIFFLSSIDDYKLVNKVIEKIKYITKCDILEDDNSPIIEYPVFNLKNLKSVEIEHALYLKSAISEGESAIIEGPIRDVHFGKKQFQLMKDFEGEELRDYIMGIIKVVQYDIPEDWDEPKLPSSEYDENTIRTKFLKNDSNIILRDFNYYYFDSTKKLETKVAVNHEGLIKSMPDSWILFDEYQILAPQLNDSEWNAFINRASEFNVYSEIASWA